MMIIRAHNTILFLIICIVISTVAKTSTDCDRSCGTNQIIQYPFGFSPGCPIQLKCSDNGTAFIDEFAVQSINPDSILINLPAKCDRPIKALHQLFTQNYAPTSQNGILLQNCTVQTAGCHIPMTAVQTYFESHDCGSTGNKSNNISCYSEQNKTKEFIDYSNLMSSNCTSLLSAISVETSGVNSSVVSLDVQVVKLGWWVGGEECRCSVNANCTKVSPPVAAGGSGYRCQCLDGFVGDGYLDGLGCRRASSSCNTSKYMAGQCDGSTRVGILIGGVFAGAALMTSLGLICCLIRRRSKLNYKKRRYRRLSKTTGINIPIYTYKEIEKATNFFCSKQHLGTGAYGTVYAGKLHNNEWVAIKRIRNRDNDSVEQVLNEIKLLSSVSHPNLVRLLGCSIEKGEQIIVYEFMPNGTLSHHLHREEGADGLPWPVRLTIATETAQAVAYLHSAMNPPIYHRDIKSSNILLDHNFKAKVADFGLSRLGLTDSSHISTAPQGTPGYLDPQYHQNFHLSDKSDVYSFGVVLVEIITALKVVDFNRPQNEVNLAALAVDRIGKGCLEEIIDPLLEPKSDDWTISSVHKVAELAFRCLAYDKDTRPSMMEVAIELEQIRLSSCWTSAGEVITDSSEPFSCSLSSNVSDKTPSPVMTIMKKPELDCGSVLVKESGEEKELSPISVQDTCLSEESSPSLNSLLSHVVQ